jgi:hypothetical protein
VAARILTSLPVSEWRNKVEVSEKMGDCEVDSSSGEQLACNDAVQFYGFL